MQITNEAYAELARIREEQKLPDTVFVRIKIMAGGCSGFTYGLNFESGDKFDEKKDDVEHEQDKLKIVVDKKSALYLEETTLRFNTDLSSRGFVFDNPQAKRTCGCGSSFGT